MRHVMMIIQLAILLFVVNCNVFAQETRIITGSVMNEQGEKLPGVNIVEKGTNNGVVTDFNGRFSIEVSNSSQLNFSFVGMKQQSKDVDNANTMKIKMVEKNPEEKDVIVIDYKKKSTTKKKSSGASVNTTGRQEKGVKSTAFATAVLCKSI